MRESMRGISLISSPWLQQHSPACLVRLSWMTHAMGSKWPYSCCFVGCCFLDFFKTARRILVSSTSIFFPSVSLTSKWCIYTVVPTRSQLGRNHILTERHNFRMINSLSIAHITFLMLIITSISVDEILLPRYVNCLTNFRCLPLEVEIAPSCLKQFNAVSSPFL